MTAHRTVSAEPTWQALPRLFAEGQRWGWEYTQVAPFARPFRPRPVLNVPQPRWASRPALLWEKLIRSRRVWLAAALACAVLAVVMTRYGARWDARWDADQASAHNPQGDPHFVSWPPYLVAAAVVCAGIVLAGHVLLYPWLERSRRSWAWSATAAFRDYERQTAEWVQARQEHFDRERERFAASPRWFAIRPEVLRRLDVFGGSAVGWAMFLVSAGSSLLGAGGLVSVVDLSQDDVARGLAEAAQASGRPYEEVVLSARSALAGAFTGLDADDVADVLVETLHGGDERPDQSVRGTDARVLSAVCAALGAEVSIERICAGLRVLLRQEQPPVQGGALSADCYDRISGLFGETYLRSTQERIAVMESLLHQLAGQDDQLGGSLAPLSAGARLQLTRIAEHASTLASSLTAQLVLQLLLVRMRNAGGAVPTDDRTIIVAGADMLPRPCVERLSQLARRQGVRLVLMFRHLREDTEQLLGGADTIFVMQLGNATEAGKAAEFIGREHRFVVHQFSQTDTAGTSDSVNTGESASLQRGSTRASMAGGSTSVSFSQTTSVGSSQGTTHTLASGAARQRVYEFAVEPVALQTLPESMFLFVDSARRRGPRARVGDCDPRLLSMPGTCDEPLISQDPVR